MIKAAQVLQIATVNAMDRPWICSVFFVLYDGCFYWLSLPQRRHSQNITENEHVALAVVIKQDIPVMGVQVEGTVKTVTNHEEVVTVIDRYIAKYDQGKTFVERFSVGKNQHVLYKCVPEKVMLFDETTKTDQPYRDMTRELRYERN